MRAFQIVIDRRPVRAAARSYSSLRGVVDVLVDGTNVTARIGQDHAIPLLRDLAYAAADLATRRQARTTVRFYDQRDAWALGLERVGDDVLVTVFQAGAQPKVAVHERPVPGPALMRGIRHAIDDVLRPGKAGALADDLAAALRRLGEVSWQTSAQRDEEIEVRVAAQSDAPLSFSTHFPLRVRLDGPVVSEVERNDLHSLLFVGPMHVRVGEVRRVLGELHPFLVAECLVQEATDVLEAWEAGAALNHRRQIAGMTLAVRLTSAGKLSLTFGGPTTGGLQGAPTFPAVSVPSFVEAVLSFSRGLMRPILRNDRSQRNNLRMRVFRSDVRELTAALREAVREDAKLNDSPESYRAFAASLMSRREARAKWGHARMRFVSAWQAAVPGIDLCSVFLFGERLIVAGNRELAAIERSAGRLVWRAPIERGVSIAAPNGVVRLSPEGALNFHDLNTGEVSMTARLAARSGGMPAGAVVNAPGLPRLVVLSEGERHITAVDYVSGEVRWRHALGRGRSFKVRRAGRLLVVSSSEHTLTALDVSSGETVWRARNRLKFTRPVTYDGNDLYVVTSDGAPIMRGTEVLHAFDPWTGIIKWSHSITAGRRTVGAPLTSEAAVTVVTHDRRGLGLAAFDRDTGENRWELTPGFAPTTSAWTTVGDLLIVNSDNGMVSGVDLRDGSVRWRRGGREHADGDVPRQLEPVYRSGALFVPQRNVIVLRPSDGDQLGEVEADLVPDLLRVDEDGNVVVVEESGHLAAFAAGARLMLVKS
ncbi:MAG: PQQ-binding-like beta-propeller repeat protein [Myxococcota bacterium]